MMSFREDIFNDSFLKKSYNKLDKITDVELNKIGLWYLQQRDYFEKDISILQPFNPLMKHNGLLTRYGLWRIY